VRAYNQKGNSSYTPYVQVTVAQSSPAPAAPSDFAASDGGNGRAFLTWTDNSSNEDRFRHRASAELC
jgi:hypothetical protein